MSNEQIEDLADKILKGEKLNQNINLIGDKLDQMSDNENATHVENINAPHNFTATIKSNNKVNTATDSHKSKSRVSTQSETNSLTALQSKSKEMKSKLDFLLFDNINKTRKIYSRLNSLSNFISSMKVTKTQCEDNLKNHISENLELKEALAELEIKYRLSKVNK